MDKDPRHSTQNKSSQILHLVSGLLNYQDPQSIIDNFLEGINYIFPQVEFYASGSSPQKVKVDDFNLSTYFEDYGSIYYKGKLEDEEKEWVGTGIQILKEKIEKLNWLNWRQESQSSPQGASFYTNHGLNDGEELYKNFIFNSSEGIYRLELQYSIDTSLPVEEQTDLIYNYGYVAECNPAFCKMYGVNEPEDITGYSIKQFHDLENHPENRGNIKKFVENGYQISNEESIEKDFEGGFRYFSNESIGIIKEGHLLRIWGTQTDITQIKKSEQQLKDQNKFIKRNNFRMREAQRLAHLGSWEYNLKTKKVSWTDELFRIFGYQPGEFTPNMETIFNHIHGRDVNKTKKLINNCINSGKEFYCEHKVMRADGAIRDVVSIGNLFKDEDNGGEWNLIGSIIDITARKKQESDLKEINEDLIKANYELDSFVYKVSHDIRSPIASTLGLIELMRHENSVDELRNYAKLQETSLKRLDQYIKDILDYSRNARNELRKEQIDINALLENVLQPYTLMPEYKIFDIKTEISGDQDLVSDRYRLEVILNNLISNSFKYYNSHEENPFISIKFQIQPQEADIIIQDNGLGISKDEQDKIFNMFYRATEKSKGSGIGLYIVKEAIEKLGGTIDVSSKPREGTSFTINIPNLMLDE